ncbi:FHA domain-containing protein [Nocardia sp. NBC_01327]|uniref:FHA domain-containing protein n=1 Tax=Nocardia sp. NBC_01327 TaxID=2903593 RepID=UPI002E14408E|nr:FHA domain-containing protein [Nocardia sp. NBC_01327]
MLTCPAGHDSVATDFCDVCGLQLCAPGEATSTAERTTPVAEPLGEPCPQCGEPRSGRFCEGCSYDFVAGFPVATAAPVVITAPVAAATPPVPDEYLWTATISADRDYFDTMRSEDDDIEFPAHYPERAFVLRGAQVRVGRRRASGGPGPEIDLTGRSQDPGVSHVHVLFLAQTENTWALIDLGSTNGTRLNGGTDPIEQGTPIAIASGDRIHIGAWTTLTLTSSKQNRDNAS